MRDLNTPNERARPVPTDEEAFQALDAARQQSPTAEATHASPDIRDDNEAAASGVSHRITGRRVLTTALLTATLAPAVLTPAANASVNGLTDGNLGLLTQKGEEILRATKIKYFRTVVSYGTPTNDPQLKSALAEANVCTGARC